MLVHNFNFIRQDQTGKEVIGGIEVVTSESPLLEKVLRSSLPVFAKYIFSTKVFASISVKMTLDL